MLNNISHVTGSTVTATDGSIGQVKAAFFDDQSWAIRYLVVDTGTWLLAREVLISPYSIRPPLGLDKNVEVTLTREQVKGSPDIDTQQPVSRQHEREYLSYYAYPEYWAGTGMWGMDSYPMFMPTQSTPTELAVDDAMRERDFRAQDVHLRSSEMVTGYDIQATDESIGHVADFIFDEESWAIRYLVVETRNWWPGGRKVLVATDWIERIDWAARSVSVALTRDQVRNSPEYQEGHPLGREYEQRLHDTYQRKGYWTSTQPATGPTDGRSVDAVPTHAPSVYVFNTNIEAKDAIQALSESGFDVKKLSLVGKGSHGEEHPLGFYTKGDQIKAWGGAGAFWGGIWGLLFAPAVFFIPGLGLVALAGPLVTALIAGLEGAVMVGGLTALGAALTQIGLPEDQGIKYETAIKADKYVLLVHGTADDAERVSAVLSDQERSPV